MTKKWKHHKKFDSFEKADSTKEDLKKTSGLWVKIRRRADSTFDVITWKDKDKDKDD